MKITAPTERKTARRKSKKVAAKATVTASKPIEVEDDDSWVFERHDLRYGQPLLPKDQDFKTHLMALGDIELDLPRTWNRKPAK